MKKHTMPKTIIVITIVALLGFGGTALAFRQGDGSGRGNPECPGYDGKQGRGGWGPGHWLAGLNDEDRARVEALRQKYIEATEALRAQRDVKRFALKSELAQQTPDTQAALKLQQELSAVNAELGQKRIEHIIEMKKINPNAGRGFMMGYGGGHGKGGHRNHSRDCNRW